MQLKDRNVAFLILPLLLFLCVFYPSGDYWTYLYWYENGEKFTHLEEIWTVIRNILPEDYNLFRAAVWGSGLIIFMQICKWTVCRFSIALLIFGAFYIGTYGYARSAVAYMFVLVAYLAYIRDRRLVDNRILHYLIIFLLISVGVAMHRSMLILVFILLVSLRFTVSRKSIYVMIALFPFITLLLKYLLLPVVNYMLLNSEDINESANNYIKGDSASTWEFFVNVLHNLPMLVLYAFSIKAALVNNIPHVRRLASASFLIVFGAFCMYFVNEGYSLIFFYRTLYMGYPLIIIVITQGFQNGIKMQLPFIFALIVETYYLFNMTNQFLHDPMYIINQMNDRYLYY